MGSTRRVAASVNYVRRMRTICPAWIDIAMRWRVPPWFHSDVAILYKILELCELEW